LVSTPLPHLNTLHPHKLYTYFKLVGDDISMLEIFLCQDAFGLGGSCLCSLVCPSVALNVHKSHAENQLPRSHKHFSPYPHPYYLTLPPTPKLVIYIFQASRRRHRHDGNLLLSITGTNDGNFHIA
jgi:hypothetical protein